MATTADYGLGEYTYPRGWFMVATSEEVTTTPSAVRFFGEDMVLYRGQSGRPFLVEAYCPHMGTHLARNTTSYVVKDGEHVQGDNIRCPYHGWKFDRHGDCVDMPSEPAGTPLQARVKISAARGNGANPDGKLIFFGRTNYTPNNELVVTSRSDPRYNMYTNFGSRSNSYIYEPQNDGTPPWSSLQPGSQFAAPPTYWDWPYDEWVTVLWHLIPGRNNIGNNPNVSTGFKDTGIQIWVARAGVTSYTKIWDKQNYVWTFGETGDPSPWGWNCFIPSGYMNGVPASVTWTQKYAQIILSKNFIPCPQA